VICEGYISGARGLVVTGRTGVVVGDPVPCYVVHEMCDREGG